jgi:tetratricopeptide (TPR) repeat protein
MADRLYKTALDVKATVLGKKHLSLANSYDNLGKVCMAREEYDDAESYFKDALAITERILEGDDPERYGRIDRLARCLAKQNKFSEAEALYQRALNIWGSTDYGQRASFALGCLLSDQRRFAAAAPYLRRALKLAERNNGAYSVQLAPYLRKYAYVAYYLGHKGDMQSLKARADSISPIVKELKADVETGKLNVK